LILFSLLDLGANYIIDIVDNNHIISNSYIDIQFYKCIMFFA
jgi:hypothetical protein